MPTASPIIRPSTGVMEFIGTSTLKASEPATPRPAPTSEPRARTRTIAATLTPITSPAPTDRPARTSFREFVGSTVICSTPSAFIAASTTASVVPAGSDVSWSSNGNWNRAMSPVAATRTEARVAAILGAVGAVYGVEHVVDARPGLEAQAQEQQRQIAEAIAALPAEMQAAALQQAQTEMAAQLQAQVAQLGYGPLMVDGAPLASVLVAATGDIALFQFQFDDQLTVLPTNSLNDVLAGLSVGAGEVIGVSVAAIVLVLALGSLIAAGLPLLTALVGVGFGVAGSLAFSVLVPMNSITPVLGLMIGLAVGIDYALFIVNRQRRLILDEGLSAADATVRAAGTAGSAVFFAGLTVIIALTALTAINISLLNLMATTPTTTGQWNRV